MSSKNYDYYFGKEYGISLFKSSEKISKSKYILYKENSYSSITYLISSFYTIYNLNNNKLMYLSIYFSFISFFLGIFSFLWWASQRKRIHLYDVILYSNLIPTIGFYEITYFNPTMEFQSISILVYYLFLIDYLYKSNMHNKIKYINTTSSIFTSLVLIYYKNYLNFIILCFSILFKICDTYKIIDYRFFGSGTSWFHILSGISNCLFFNK